MACVRSFILPALLLIAMAGCSPTSSTRWPGLAEDGRILLPNGWSISPVGTHAEVGELPMNMVATPDGRYLIVNNDGTREHALSVIETATWRRVQHIPVAKSWLGLKMMPGGDRVIVSGGNDNRILLYAFELGRLRLADSIQLGAPRPAQEIWVGGLDCDAAGERIYVTGRASDSLYVVDMKKHGVVERCALAATPYTCLLSPDGSTLAVSLWGGSAVALLDPSTLATRSTVKVGDHPCDMVFTRDGKRLFVANANHNSVSVVAMPEGKVIETIVTSLSADAPYGSTPNALALSADGSTLYVANADNNFCALFDVREWQRTRSIGFMPTGWYPSALAVIPGDGRIAVASAKGFTSKANPQGPNPTGRRSAQEEYIGSLFRGMVTALPPPTEETLRQTSARVYANTPHRGASAPAGEDHANAVPFKEGAPSPIKHVFYIIKENRTYDQVFGDMPEGNGAPELCLFPEEITPNHHALARQFVLLDNFYCNAEVSADGHNWSMGAYATDYVEKSWPTSYGGRGGEYEFEGGFPDVYPSNGYLWDNCLRNGVSFRNYGEWAENPDAKSDTAKALMPSLVGHVAPRYRGWDMGYSDVDRVKAWMAEFDAYERDGGLPQFMVLKLPNDHTEGTKKGSLTPQAFVAQNDLALGMFVERLSRSRYWKESAVFVVEDDAQNGPDHVDAHRTVALVISPWTRHGVTDSELYSTTSMIRTMELILGLPPLTQHDAAATPMYASFSRTADVSPYQCRPARIDITQKNSAGAVGQERSGQLDFSGEDRIPDLEFSEIIWKAVKGAGSPMSPPVRSAFVRVAPERDDD